MSFPEQLVERQAKRSEQLRELSPTATTKAGKLAAKAAEASRLAAEAQQGVESAVSTIEFNTCELVRVRHQIRHLRDLQLSEATVATLADQALGAYLESVMSFTPNNASRFQSTATHLAQNAALAKHIPGKLDTLKLQADVFVEIIQTTARDNGVNLPMLISQMVAACKVNGRISNEPLLRADELGMLDDLK